MLGHIITKCNTTLPYHFCLGTMMIAACEFYINCLLPIEVYNTLLKSQEK